MASVVVEQAQGFLGIAILFLNEIFKIKFLSLWHIFIKIIVKEIIY